MTDKLIRELLAEVRQLRLDVDALRAELGKALNKRIHWFAAGGGVERMGPFPTETDAYHAVLAADGGFVPGAFVWPEVMP